MKALREVKAYNDANYKITLDTREAILDAYQGKSEISISLKLKKLYYLSDSAYDNLFRVVAEILNRHK